MLTTNHTVEYDPLWKDIIAEMFEDFLRFFAPELSEQVDFSKQPEYLEQELRKLFPDSKTNKRHTDKLAKVYLKNGTEQWILIHVEIQGGNEQNFSERMFRYFYRVFDKYNKKIFAISIFTDTRSRNLPQYYDYEFYGTKLTYQYNTYKIATQNEAELLTSKNPFAFVVLTALYVSKIKNNQRLSYSFKKKLFQLLLDDEAAKESGLDRTQLKAYMNQLFTFIDAIIALPEQESVQLYEYVKPHIDKERDHMGLSIENTSFAQIFRKQGLEEGLEKGIEKGIEKGREEGKKEVAKQMLSEGMSIELISKFTKIPIEIIEELRKNNT